MAQLNENQLTWNVVDASSDANFDSSSSLTEGLWGVFKHKISNTLAHLLIFSDVWRVSDESSAKLWCDFVMANYENRLMSINSSDFQLPVGFRSCTRPFGRLLASFDANFVQSPKSRLNAPLRWLLQRIAQNEGDDSQKIKQVTFNQFNIVFDKLINHVNLFRTTLSIGFYSGFHRTCIRVSETYRRQGWATSLTISLKTPSRFLANGMIPKWK